MRIVVTGFGPFGTFQANPSTEVVNGLAAGFDYEPVELIVQTVPVEYGEALKCSRMACEELEAEFVIHVGVQPFWGQLCLETRSFSHGYISPDVKGMVPLLNCCEAKPKTNENVQPKEAAAKTLNTSIDCEQLKQNVLAAFEGKKEELPVQIKISDDPGRFLCAYIYYYSLLHTNGRCLFVHIPPFDEECTPAVLIAALKQIVIELHKMNNATVIPKLENLKISE